MDYLGGWRMQLAGDLLRSSGEPLVGVAEQVGYASVAAFSRAFRPMSAMSTATPPAASRRSTKSA